MIPQVPFTTQLLRQQNPHVSAFVIQRNLEDWMATGAVRRTRAGPQAGKRKAFYVYEIAKRGS